MNTPSYRHWQVESGADRICRLTLDVADSTVNTLSAAVLEELESIVGALEQDIPTGVIIRSGKDGGFIAGADVREFTTVEDHTQARAFIEQVHNLFDRIEALRCPTLCLINGFCLGGGLELALSCRYRIALDDPGTRLGFPEILIGIFPGFGGSMRSVRRLGALQALQLMLTGRNVDARKAAKLGLIDYALPARELDRAATRLVVDNPGAKPRRFMHRLMDLAPVRALLTRILRAQVRKRARPAHYPAPFALLDHWRDNGGSEHAMLRGEAATVSHLVTTDTSRNLVRAFLLQERLKSSGKGVEFTPKRVHVIGAGVMGGDIAAWCALRGMQVTLQDREARFIAPAIGRAHKLFKRRLKVSRLVQAAMDRLMPDPDGTGVGRADVVIEAIIENEEAKLSLFRDIEPRLGAETVLATNTSSISLEILGRGLAQPGRLVGIHFFNPVAVMQLIEIVHAPGTGAEWVQRAAAFCKQIGKLPLPVRSAPGFLVNRILSPYLLETVVMLQEGLQPELVDRAALEFGMPMGPVELADTVGLDVCLSVAQHMQAQLKVEIPPRFETMVETGRLGKKAGRGFYEYHKGKAQKDRIRGGTGRLRELEDRLVMRILNECAACLREGIVDDADLLDAGMIFGTGFAPFRGGPMHYAAARGHASVADALTQLEARYGERFAPDPWWRNAAGE